MNPESAFIGFDISGSPGFQNDSPEIGEDWFCLVGVLAFDFKVAESVNQELTSELGERKGTKSHKYYDKIVRILSGYPLHFFVLLFNKFDCPPFLDTNWKDVITSDSPGNGLDYTVLGKQFSMPGWSIADILRASGFKGHVEIRTCGDLSGPRWEQFKIEVSTHVTNHIGTCDMRQADESYPLIRIADLVANNVRFQAKKKILKNGQLKIISDLQPNVKLMEFKLTTS